ncbi:hypothetical protein AVEN_140605-1 [Araneus ventricosus]|uniref:Uncharacterized protein n=1 Tax=Araneus ventricosus TaxID=182803 RepID=A0A4Y2N8J4_ARAVE|nr:hypothetical protein AVEN_164948-1 [Araneus ventricosus]GBN34994.1 hypothetical protein AVEN_140605-1 [Araneus ventricosus]
MDIAREQAYPTPFAASPLLPMLLLSLATQRNAPKQATTFKDEYDYIIAVFYTLEPKGCIRSIVKLADDVKTILHLNSRLEEVPPINGSLEGEAAADWPKMMKSKAS